MAHDNDDDSAFEIEVACCPGFTIDVTVGEASINLHGHAFLSPEVLDTFLTRMTGRATAADVARTRVIHAMFAADRAPATPTTDQA